MSTTNNASVTTVTTVTCGGCGKEFKGARGLASHQSHRNAPESCRPDGERVPELAESEYDNTLPVSVKERLAAVDRRVTVAEQQVAYQEAAEPAPAPRDDIDYGGYPIPAQSVDQLVGPPYAEDVYPLEMRNQVIGNARRFARVPEFRTTLVHLTGHSAFATPTAWRWHPEDAEALTATALSSSVIRITKHDEGRAGETVITDFYWADGLRARVTEKFAI